jgi:hypothetical protein
MNCASANATDLVEFANTGASVSTDVANSVAQNCSAPVGQPVTERATQIALPYWITESGTMNNAALQFLPYNSSLCIN